MQRSRDKKSLLEMNSLGTSPGDQSLTLDVKRFVSDASVTLELSLPSKGPLILRIVPTRVLSPKQIRNYPLVDA